MNYKILVTPNGLRVIKSGDAFALSSEAPFPDLFDAELMDVLPLRSIQPLVALVSEPIYQMLVERQQFQACGS